MLKWTTAGESHGPALVATLEGVPAGVHVDTALINDALAERRLGYGRGARQKFEKDKVEILTGVRHGKSTGAPITILIHNSEWPKWRTVMSADPVPPEDLLVDAGKGDKREMARNRSLTRPRPGHADLAGALSYRHEDARNILERASARETAARVALGAIAKQLLLQTCGAEVVSHVVQVGPTVGSSSAKPRPSQRGLLRNSPMRTLSEEDEASFIQTVDTASKEQETVGGVAEIIAYNVPLGLGSHVSAEDKLDAALAWALMSIQSAKAIEIGEGFQTAATFGSAAHDEILLEDGTVTRASNRAGGIEGGTSNGQPIIARVAFKPISTVPRALASVDLSTGEATSAFHQRSDTCQVVPGAVIGEAMVALVLAQMLTKRYGGASVEEVTDQVRLQERYVSARLQPNMEGKVK